MKKEITPEDSVVPIYLESRAKEQIETDLQERKEYEMLKQTKEQAKAAAQAKLAALGLTIEDLQALGL